MKSKQKSKKPFLNFLPKYDERMMIIGMTGSGKTFFAEKILRWRDNVIVYDTKGQIDWEGYQTVTSFSELKSCSAKKIRYKPKLEDWYNEEPANEFFSYVYHRGDSTLYVDEVATACYDGQIPFWLHGIMSRGRELGVSFIGSTQRPKRIPLSLLSESERWAIFRLNLMEDAKRVEQTFGFSVEQIQSLPKRFFHYGSIDMSRIEVLTQKPFTLKV